MKQTNVFRLPATLHYLVLIIFFSGLFSSCSKKELRKPDDFYSIPESNVRLVPTSIAKLVAENFNPNNFFTSHGKQSSDISQNRVGLNSESAKSNGSDKLAIKEMIVINDHAEVPAMYVFNFQDKKGCLFVSADSGMRPILAYVPNGEYKKTNASGGTLKWINKTINNFELVRKKLVDNRKQSQAAWRNYISMLDQSVVSNAVKSTYHVNVRNPDLPDPCISDPYYTDLNVTTHGPLVAVEWGQKDTYNDLLAYGSCTTIGNQKYPTGCAATAMAQVAYRWQSPINSYGYSSNYNWASMPTTIGDVNVQRLMADAGASVSMNYACSGSYLQEVWHIGYPRAIALGYYSTAQQIVWGLQSAYFGYSADWDWYDNVGHSKVLSEVSSSRPVIMAGYADWNPYLNIPSGDGHVWVIDGTSEYQYFYCVDGHLGGSTYLYFHMNWGRNEAYLGGYNGWYAFDNWYVAGFGLEYSYADEIVFNIHP